MKYHTIKTVLSAAFFTFLAVSCGDDPDYMTEKDDANFVVNDSLAYKRLKQVAYSISGDNLRGGAQKLFMVAHISDAHLSPWSNDNNYKAPLNLIQTVRFVNTARNRINALVFTGDCIGNSPKTTQNEAISYFQAFTNFLFSDSRVPTFVCSGNHDANMLAVDPYDRLSVETVHQLMTNHPRAAALMPGGKNYYYADLANPQGGYIRIIALDMLEQESDFTYNTQHYAFFSAQQVDWLCNTALKEGMTDRHSVLLLTHFPFQPTGAHSFLRDGEFVHTWQMIPEIIEAFRTKTVLDKTYPNKFNRFSPIHVNVDYSAVPGEFICHLGGHIHATARFTIDGLSNQSVDLPRQHMLLCTNMSPTETSPVFNKVHREAHTVTSNAFCIYAIDTSMKKMYITFFGAYKPADEATYPEIQEIYYL